MTTVAYKAGIMASDSRITASDIAYAGTAGVKVYELPRGLMGMAGSADELPLTDELIDGLDSIEDLRDTLEELSKASREYTMLIVFKDEPTVAWIADTFFNKRTEEWDYGAVRHELDEGGIAIGSGDNFAMAAMQTGWSAPDSITLAAKFDINTDDRVQEYYLKDV